MTETLTVSAPKLSLNDNPLNAYPTTESLALAGKILRRAVVLRKFYEVDEKFDVSILEVHPHINSRRLAKSIIELNDEPGYERVKFFYVTDASFVEFTCR